MLKKLLFFLLIPVTCFANNLDINLYPKTPKQGDTLKIEITTSQNIQNSYISFLGKRYSVFAHPLKPLTYFSYIGIPASLPAKTYFLDFKYSSPIQKKRLLIKTQIAPFHAEKLTLTPQKQALQKNTPKLDQELGVLIPKFKKISPEFLFSQPFIIPTPGRYSSTFGSKRVYNGKVNWQHAGLDIAAATGTPVKASNKGVVILIAKLKIHGNTIVIDHGHGIITAYLHLHQMNVNLGDHVSRGQIIGQVGQSGISTGPHLHWTMSIQNTRVNPLFWINNQNIYL